ncbi:hypothetical protein ABPG74_012140 [Tetrahymena malaccensis]
MCENLSKITKSQNDKREYKAIRLENKMTVVLISDPETDKSGVAMNVFVGVLEDPVDREGLAHYLEHMLFLGTEKYPNQSEYMDYLSKNSGLFNAYTDLMETNYFFECSNSAFEGGIDRFAQFFIAPLFTESCAKREMNAVNSEHQLYFKQDIWRQFQLLRHSAKKGNPLNKFGVGSLETLDHPNIREDLIKFFEKYYSSNQMKLVIYSNQSISQLENLVMDKFWSVKNKDIDAPKYEEKPFDATNQGNFWRVTPVKDEDYLKFMWTIDHTLPHYKSNPAKYISHLIGHEGENSLLSFLKEEGLALELSSGYHDYMNLFTIFEIEIKLTQKGLQNYQNVVDATFAYLKVLREKGAQEWIFQEIQTISKLKFDNIDKQKIMQYTLSLASKLQFYDIEDILVQPYLFESYNKDLIQKYIDSLDTSNLRIFLQSKTQESLCNQTEPIYGTKFSCEKFDELIIKSFENPDLSFAKSQKKLDLPPPNNFIPKSMAIFGNKDETSSKLPVQIQDNVWFKQDNTFLTPKGQISLFVYFKDCDIPHNVQNVLHSKIWELLFNHYVSELTYMADLAYLSFRMAITPIQLKLDFKGFNDSLPNFTLQILEKLVSFNPLANQELFNNIYQQVAKETENFFKNPPFQQIASYVDYLVRTGFHSPQQKAEAIKEITFESFTHFVQQWMKNLRFEWLIVGNFEKQAALDVTNQGLEILKKLNYKTIQQFEINQIRAYQLNPNQTIVWQRDLPEGDENSTCTKLYQYPQECTIRNHNLLDLVQTFLRIPAFTQLRTVEQLGYVVFTSVNTRSGIGGIVFVVQSNVKPPIEVSNRIKAFVQSMEEKLTNMTEEQFKVLVDGVKNTIKEKDTDIFSEAVRYEEAINTQYIFGKKQKRVEDIENVTMEEFIKFGKSLLYQEPRSLEFYLVSKKHKEEQNQLLDELIHDENYAYYKDIETIQSRLALYPYYYSKV